MHEDALIAWDDEGDPRGNVRHIAHNGISMDDFEHVLGDPRPSRGLSRSSGRHTAWGELPDGHEIVIVFEVESDDPPVIRPVTAFEAED